MRIYRGENCLICGRAVSSLQHARRTHGEKHVREGRATKASDDTSEPIYEAVEEMRVMPCLACGGYFCEPAYCVTRKESTYVELRASLGSLEGTVAKAPTRVGFGDFTGFALATVGERAQLFVAGVFVCHTPRPVLEGHVLRLEDDGRGVTHFMHEGKVVYSAALGMPEPKEEVER